VLNIGIHPSLVKKEKKEPPVAAVDTGAAGAGGSDDPSKKTGAAGNAPAGPSAASSAPADKKAASVDAAAAKKAAGKAPPAGKDDKKGAGGKDVKGGAGVVAEENEVVTSLEISNLQVDYGTIAALEYTHSVVKSINTLKFYNVGLQYASLMLLAPMVEDSNIFTLHIDYNTNTNMSTNKRILDFFQSEGIPIAMPSTNSVSNSNGDAPSRPSSRVGFEPSTPSAGAAGAKPTAESATAANAKKAAPNAAASSSSSSTSINNNNNNVPTPLASAHAALQSPSSASSYLPASSSSSSSSSASIPTLPFGIFFTASSPVQIISLRSCGIRDEVAIEIFQRIKAMGATCKIISLNLSLNQLTEASMPSLVDMLLTNKSIISLNLSGNKISKGCGELCSAFLCPEVNKDEAAALKAQGKAVVGTKTRSFRECNTTLRQIDLSNTDMDVKAAIAVMELVGREPTKLALQVESNQNDAEFAASELLRKQEEEAAKAAAAAALAASAASAPAAGAGAAGTTSGAAGNAKSGASSSSSSKAGGAAQGKQGSNAGAGGNNAGAGITLSPEAIFEELKTLGYGCARHKLEKITCYATANLPVVLKDIMRNEWQKIVMEKKPTVSISNLLSSLGSSNGNNNNNSSNSNNSANGNGNGNAGDVAVTSA
jgi:hypothetical protein